MSIEYISQFVFNNWKQTFDKYGCIINCTEKNIYDKYIKALERQDCTLQEKCNQLSNIYYEIIQRYATLYAKEELVIGLIAVKEFITKNMTKLGDRLQYIDDERDCINILIWFINSLDISEFKNHCIDSVDNYISDIFIWGRLLTQLEANLERYKIAEQKKTCLREMAFGIVEDKVFHDFYEEYERQGLYEKFEDYEIKNINIKKQTERLNVSPTLIREDANKIVQDSFRFCLSTLRKLSEIVGCTFFETREDLLLYIRDDSVMCDRIGFPKNVFYTLGERVGVSQDEINTILQVFSFENKGIREIELSCFYLSEDIVFFGPCDMLQVFGMFEKFSLSGYFLDCYKENTNFIELLNPCQKRIATYMSYVLADVLVGEGYKMHVEKFTYNRQVYYSPCAEIKTILNGKKNILKDAGDIDVLFLDDYKKQVICVEYKYFQPAISYEQMCKSDRNKITNQVYEKNKQIQCRENIVRENIECVVEFLGGSGKKYDVKTIIVLSRPNMYVFTEESSERIKYEIMTMNEFCDKAMLHDL